MQIQGLQNLLGGNRVKRQISGTLKRVEVHVTDQGCDSLASREAPVWHAAEDIGGQHDWAKTEPSR